MTASQLEPRLHLTPPVLTSARLRMKTIWPLQIYLYRHQTCLFQGRQHEREQEKSWTEEVHPHIYNSSEGTANFSVSIWLCHSYLPRHIFLGLSRESYHTWNSSWKVAPILKVNFSRLTIYEVQIRVRIINMKKSLKLDYSTRAIHGRSWFSSCND